MRKIFLRADGNFDIGHGHISRLLSIADLIRENFQCSFISRNLEPGIENRIKKYCEKYIRIDSLNPVEEAKYLCQHIIGSSDILVVDSYTLDSSYQEIIKDHGCLILQIDDLNAFKSLADIIINPSGSVDNENYRRSFYTQLLFGPEYAPLKNEFLQEQGKQTPGDPAQVLICLGGSDASNYTMKVMEELAVKNEKRKFHIVLGSSYENEAELSSQLNNSGCDFSIYVNLDAQQMKDLMKICGYAICSASTISYEYCSVGGNLFLIKYADNQGSIYDFLIENGMAESYHSGLFKQKGSKMVHNQMRFFTGKVKNNIPTIIDSLWFYQKLRIRSSVLSDADLYFEWVNDAEVRENSIQMERVDYPGHLNWFKKKIADPDVYMYVFEFKKQKVGQVRFELVEDHYLIDFSLDSTFRGKGIGYMILKKAILYLKNIKNPGIRFRALVKDKNEASWRVFDKLNFNFRSNINKGNEDYREYILETNGFG